MEKPIDLGVKASNPTSVPTPSEAAPEKYFPSCYVSDVDLEDLPEVGTMEVKYRLSRSEKNHKTGKWSYTIELEQILSAEGSEDLGKGDEREQDLDEMLDEAEGDES